MKNGDFTKADLFEMRSKILTAIDKIEEPSDGSSKIVRFSAALAVLCLTFLIIGLPIDKKQNYMEKGLSNFSSIYCEGFLNTFTNGELVKVQPTDKIYNITKSDLVVPTISCKSKGLLVSAKVEFIGTKKDDLKSLPLDIENINQSYTFNFVDRITGKQFPYLEGSYLGNNSVITLSIHEREGKELEKHTMRLISK